MPTDEATPEPSSPERRSGLFVSWPLFALGAVVFLVVLALVGIVAEETWTRWAWDHHAWLASADRVHRLGGTYYTAGVDHKGPLGPALYELLVSLASRRDVWFAVGTAVVAMATLTGAAIAALLLASSTPIWAALAAGVAAGIHLVFGGEEWTKTFYTRNLVALLSVAMFTLIVLGSRWQGRRGLAAALIAGILGGIAAQTNLGSSLTGGLGLVAILILGTGAGPYRAGWKALAKTSALFVAGFLVALLAAPIWYAARGVFEDFWGQWWTYNVWYAQGPGRTYLEIAQQGLDDLLRYYTDNWWYAAVAGLYVLGYVVAFRWLSDRERRLGVVLILWWLAELVAVGMSQRFFPHYLILPFIPVAVMAGALLGKLGALIGSRWGADRRFFASAGVLGVAVVLAVVLFNGFRVKDALAITWDFRGLEDTAARHVSDLEPQRERLREVVALNSEPDDFVYAWSNYPHVYTDIGRSAASRYVERRWLVGEIYGAGVSPDWILPGTWERWTDDIRTTRPQLVLTFPDFPVPEGSPLEELVACGYEEIHADEYQTVYRRTDAFDRCLPGGSS